MIQLQATSPSSILVVDDNDAARRSMVSVLRCAGHEVSDSGSAQAALQMLEQRAFDVVVTDLNMPGMSGLEFMAEMQSRRYESQVVMVTAYASVETAVEAMRYGAFDYIEKPFDVDQLEDLVARALRRSPEQSARGASPASVGPGAMIGNSPAMQRLRLQIAQTAPTDVTVLILGESGVGKELVAREIHAASARAARPLISVNCPALSPQLAESELFGHERGAFTSADSPRVGRFELADGGTIFLDEITEIELPTQAKLLRVLQERTFEKVGSSISRSVDTRVIAASNRDLQQLIAAGSFREDLYYRLAVIPLVAPSLRERREDIPALCEHFLHQAAERTAADPRRLTDAAQELLTEYSWPGNVRELQNVMLRASVLAPTHTIDADALEPWLLQSSSATTPSAESDAIAVGGSLKDMERKLIEATLEHYGGHREKTAKALDIGVRTLSTKLRQYGYAPREKPRRRLRSTA